MKLTHLLKNDDEDDEKGEINESARKEEKTNTIRTWYELRDQRKYKMLS